MGNTNLLVLNDSFLNTFLYTEVGIERNGSPLTVLSVLARLGKDPWGEAENWRRMPQAKAVDCLVQDLLEMPVYSERFSDARAAAAQAVQILRSGQQKKRQYTIDKSAKITMVLLFCVFALGLGCNIFLMSKMPAEILSANADTMSGW